MYFVPWMFRYFYWKTRRKQYENVFSLPKEICLKVKLLGRSGSGSHLAGDESFPNYILKLNAVPMGKETALLQLNYTSPLLLSLPSFFLQP